MVRRRRYWHMWVVMLSFLICIGCVHIKPVEGSQRSSSVNAQQSQLCLLHKADGRFSYVQTELICQQRYRVDKPIKLHWLDLDRIKQNLDAKDGSGNEIDHETEAGQDDTEEEKPTVYLTFDDGPGKYTESILDLLKEEDILATFFVLGVQVEKFPETTKRLVKEGHSIGNHSYNHVYKEIYTDFDVFAEQYTYTNQLIHKETAVDTRLLRAPGGTAGNFDSSYFEAVIEAGFRVFDWNVDSRDSSSRTITSEEIIDIIKESKLYEHTFVLLHDSNTNEQSYLALPEIIRYYREQGYRFAAITEHTEPLTFRIAEKSKWQRNPVSTEQKEAFAYAIQHHLLYE